jgi:hypothetical protein
MHDIRVEIPQGTAKMEPGDVLSQSVYKAKVLAQASTAITPATAPSAPPVGFFRKEVRGRKLIGKSAYVALFPPRLTGSVN